MKNKNSIVLLLLLSLFATNTNARGGLVNDMIGVAAFSFLGFGAVTIGGVTYTGYKGYQHLKYHLSSTPEKVEANIEHINAQIDRIHRLINAQVPQTEQEREQLLKVLKKLEVHKLEQARITLEHNIRKADQ